MALLIDDRSAERILATELTPTVKLSRSPLQDFAETLILVLGGAVVCIVGRAELTGFLNRRRILYLEYGLASVDVCLEVLTEWPVLLVRIRSAAAGLENSEV